MQQKTETLVPGQAAGAPVSAPDKLWKLSRSAFRNRDYELAESLLARLIDEFGDNTGPAGAAEWRLLIGITRLRLRRTEEGVADLKRAVELAPEVARAHYKLGLGLARLRRNGEALKCFLSAAALERDNVEYLTRLGHQFNRTQQFEKAATTYHRVLALDPVSTAALAGLRDCAEQLSKLQAVQESSWSGTRFKRFLKRFVERVNAEPLP